MYFKKGFTLIEILIVIIIIAMTVAIIYPVSTKIIDKFSNYIKKAEQNNTQKKEKFEKFIKDEK